MFWVFWCGAEGGEGPRIGPFHDRQDAERHMQGELRRFAAKLVHGTGEEGT